MSIGETLKSIKKKLVGAAAGVMEEITGLRQRIAGKQRELEAATQAPLPLEEIEQHIAESVAERGEMWLSAYGTSLVHGERSLGAYGHRGSFELPLHHGEQMATWDALCAGDPQRAAAMLRTMVSRVPFEAGASTATRPEVLRRLQQELRELEESEESTIDAAIAAGLTIAHRPEVISRRYDETRRRERDEAAIENRRAREAALNQNYSSRARRARRNEEAVRQRSEEISHLSRAGRR